MGFLFGECIDIGKTHNSDHRPCLYFFLYLILGTLGRRVAV